MKKILISAAIITGLIAPVIYATAQYASYNSQKGMKILFSNGVSGKKNTFVSSDESSCIKLVLEEYSSGKMKLADDYKRTLKNIIKQTSASAVSGEKSMRVEKIKSAQKEYNGALLKLKNTTKAQQRNCVKN